MAVSEVSFEVEAGTVVGLIGPNGAGKTTVFNLITGNYRPDSGSVIFDGENLTGHPAHAIVEKGIARTFQAIRLFQNMSLLENVLAGRHCRMRAGALAAMLRTPAQRREEKEAIARAMDELRFVGLEDRWQNPAGSLAYGNQRLLEIARTRLRLVAPEDERVKTRLRDDVAFASAPGCDEPTSRCQTSPSIWTLGRD